MPFPGEVRVHRVHRNVAARRTTTTEVAGSNKVTWHNSWTITKSKILQLAFFGLLLFSMLTLSYMLQHQWTLPASMFRLSAFAHQKKSSSVSEEVSSFMHTVLGYSQFPDQCRTRRGLPPHITEAKYDFTNEEPIHFLPNFRDKGTNELRCLPYFYVSGYPKCGSTDMYRRILLHPLVLKVNKEIHWLTKRRFWDSRPLMWYTKLYGTPFENSANANISIVGDGSPSLMHANPKWTLVPGNENCTEPRIITADYLRALHPNAKIITMLRNPTPRLYSDYTFHKAREEHPSQERFHRFVQQSIAAFNACRKRHSLRRCAYNESLYKVRLHIGLYSIFVEDFLLRFSRKHILFLRLEDYQAEHVMPTVFQFLGLEYDDVIMQKVLTMNPQNVGKSSEDLGPMWPKTARLLDAFYRPFNIRLQQILQDRRFAWEEA